MAKNNEKDIKELFPQSYEILISPTSEAVLLPIHYLLPHLMDIVFIESDLEALAEDIEERGVIKPIVVRKISDEPVKYQIRNGHRRTKAALMVGLTEIPCIIEEPDERSE